LSEAQRSEFSDAGQVTEHRKAVERSEDRFRRTPSAARVRLGRADRLLKQTAATS